MPQRPGAPGSVWKRSLPIYFSSLLLLGDFWKRRERCWVYPWDLGLQTRGHCGLPQPAALPPALIGYSVAVTSTRPTPFALPLCQGVTGLCLRVEFWRRSSVLVVPSLGTLLRQGDWEQPILRPQTTLAFSQRVWDPDPRGDADAAVSAAPGAALRSEHLRSESQAWSALQQGWLGRSLAPPLGAWPGRPDGQHVRGVARPSATRDRAEH